MTGQVTDRTIEHFRSRGIRLPKLSELAEPKTIPAEVAARLPSVDLGAPDPLNLFRVHWYNDPETGGIAELPGFMEIPTEITGGGARIIAMLGERFPMITAHKVLAAYACLVPRLVGGEFDPIAHRAVWPSTGNYCRGGVAISRILGCRGVAVLPEGMSAERFRWLEQWVSDPADIVRTYGTESNVKEIYDACHELSQDPGNVILNQFSEYGNYLAHRLITARAIGDVFEHLNGEMGGDLELAAYVAGTGSAGTLGAGDHLKDQYGTAIVAVEPTECPTLLRNGYGDHNIQGIGDKHVPLIHNVMNTDSIVGVSHRSGDALNLLFNTGEGRDYLASRRGLSQQSIASLSSLGLSGIANVLSAIKTSRHYGMGSDQVIFTIATDNASLYDSQIGEQITRDHGGNFDQLDAAAIFGEHVAALGEAELLELTHRERQRVFNLGYYTWVEQQGVSLEDFDARKAQSFWRGLTDQVAGWDAGIEEFNARVGLA